MVQFGILTKAQVFEQVREAKTDGKLDNIL